MMRAGFLPLILLVGLWFVPAPARAQDDVTLFETRVRPVLADHCYKCHSTKSEKLKGGLLLDSREGLFKGGETGAVVVPGHPEQSRLIDAIGYQDVDLQMPPKAKLSAQQIEDLTAWVKRGTPWPAEAGRPAVAQGDADHSFDIQRRKASHWAWQPVRVVPAPKVKHTDWVTSPIDAFVLAKLEEKGLEPALPADKRALVRRVYFDLVGLPPTPEEVEQFLSDTSGDAYEKLVDRLLASPHFGERWGRHWLDLVRYAETYGHEFDYAIPSAREYLLYVIRAFNADLPYDQFVTEHIAGDLVEKPRLNPAEGFNESVIGSGFWQLGEQVHGPVDVRQHQADRIANQIDVFSKAFQGLTIACARCHDHKFDPISTQDYYALFGVLESSRLQHAYLDPQGKIGAAVARMKAIRAEADTFVGATPASPVVPVIDTTGEAGLAPTNANAGDAGVAPAFETFDVPDYRNWFPTGWAFGDGPTHPGQWDSCARGPRLALPGVAHSGMLSPRLRGVLRSKSFTVPDGSIDYRLAGDGDGNKIRLVIDGYIMDAYNSVLFEGISFPVDTNGQFKWHRQSTKMYAGHRAHLELIDDGDGWIAVDEIRFANSNQAAPPSPGTPGEGRGGGSGPIGNRQSAIGNPKDPHPNPPPEYREREQVEIARRLADCAHRLDEEAQSLPEPMRALAMSEGDGIDSPVFIRGSHKTPGQPVPRRFLEAISGTDPFPTTGSGRLELARRVTDPSNPLTARVMVNRVWHHLFGRGIVPSVDDFGVMGQPPTHPELLDYLADRFVKEGWSIKKLIRAIVLSSTYRMASVPRSEGVVAQVDPQNTLLHHMPVRRLEAESIRDAILAVSGRLDRTVYAPRVEVYLTPFMEGRGKPQSSGPIDGNGERSIYLAVRRNFLPPMMLAFDAPTPFSTIGRRSVSNVPAQALILLNDPFVTEQAKVWADRIVADERLSTPDQRVTRMYEEAFSRPPTAQELSDAMTFVAQHPDPSRAWADLAHVLMNVKEFIFLN